MSQISGRILKFCQSNRMSDESARMDLLWETIQKKEDYPIFRLCYLSQPTQPFTDEILHDIESKSIEANNARDVTGLLILKGESILQILEGAEDAVRELYAKIEADSRHSIVKLVSAGEDEVRLLATWSMVVKGTTATPSSLLEQFSQVYEELLHTEEQSEIAIDHVNLFREIALFETLPKKS